MSTYFHHIYQKLNNVDFIQRKLTYKTQEYFQIYFSKAQDCGRDWFQMLANLNSDQCNLRG
jgi:hypothetical protein